MLRDERVEAHSDALKAGKGVYAIATKGDNSAAVMIWNYQGTDGQAYRVTLDMTGMPATASGLTATQRQYRIDQENSNYWTDPDKANLQQVDQSSITIGDGHQVTIKLPANSLHLVTLDIESSHYD